MKKVICLIFLSAFFASLFAQADVAFSPFEKEKMKKEIQSYWKHFPHKKHFKKMPPPPLNPEELAEIKKGIVAYNAHQHWDRRCKDAAEAPMPEWQKFLRKWPKKQRKLFFMAQHGDLHPSAANDFYLFGDFTTADWENFRQTCHLGIPPELKSKMDHVENKQPQPPLPPHL